MMAYQAEKRWINTGISSCVGLDLQWLWLSIAQFYIFMLATCNAQEPQDFVRFLILLFKLMMAYQAETRWINTGISSCVGLDLQWLWLSVAQRGWIVLG